MENHLARSSALFVLSFSVHSLALRVAFLGTSRPAENSARRAWLSERVRGLAWAFLCTALSSPGL